MALRALGRQAVALALVLVACSGTGPRSRTSASDTTPTSSAAAPSEASVAGGTLVVVDGAGDIVTMRPDGSQRHALTDDGGVVGYRQPLWSPISDDLVWAADDAADAGSAIVISDGVDLVSIAMPALPIFSMWSPDGSRIAVLHDGSGGGLDLEIINLATGDNSVVSVGAPFYFAWSPDGDLIAGHLVGQLLGLVGEDGITPIAATAGDFQAPVWTDSGIFYFEGGSLVVRADPEAEVRAIAGVTGPGTMVATPVGNRLAVQIVGSDEPGVFAALQTLPEIPAGAVIVLDVETGSIDVAAGRTSFGHFWSPDGDALLLLVAASTEGELEWWVWRDGVITTRVAFAPAASLVRELLPFFDQYAQAWSPWAPDSSAFAFVGTIGSTTGVWVQELGTADPQFVSDGDWVAWSAH